MLSLCCHTAKVCGDLCVVSGLSLGSKLSVEKIARFRDVWILLFSIFAIVCNFSVQAEGEMSLR